MNITYPEEFGNKGQVGWSRTQTTMTFTFWVIVTSLLTCIVTCCHTVYCKLCSDGYNDAWSYCWCWTAFTTINDKFTKSINENFVTGNTKYSIVQYVTLLLYTYTYKVCHAWRTMSPHLVQLYCQMWRDSHVMWVRKTILHCIFPHCSLRP